MTIEEMSSKLKQLGIKKRFKPYWLLEEERIGITVRKQVKIVEGYLTGSEIVLSGEFFKVWTPQFKKAKAVADKHKIKCRSLDGEAELLVPPSLADELLPQFGARVKRVLSEKQLEVLKSARQHLPGGPNFTPKPCKTGPPDA